LGSKLKGKAVADLLHIEAARLRKSIELDTVILALEVVDGRVGEDVCRGLTSGDTKSLV
jgi:hypothetical protein